MIIRRPGWVFVVTATLVLTCLVTLASMGRPGAPAFSVLHSRQNIGWLSWLILAPGVVAVARRLPFGGSSMQWLLGHTVIGGFFALAALAVAAALERLMALVGHAHDAQARPPLVASVATGLLIYALIATSYQAIAYHITARSREAAAEKLRADLAEARLANLEGKLHPHFLFNALNSIAALIRSDPPGAELMLEQLSDLLRATLRANPAQEVTLADALVLTEQYLAIERVRYRERLSATVNASDAARDCLVPQLMLQPIVENSVRHGIAPVEGGGRITVTAWVDAERLRITVEDDGVGLGKADGKTAGSGIGLRAVRSVLSHVYGSAHDFDIRAIEPRGTLVSVTLPCRTTVA